MTRQHDDGAPRVAVPADVDTPDRIAWGLTARQLAILAVAGTAGYGLYQTLAPLVPQLVLAAVGLPVAGLVVTVVLGRRDGLPADRWLLAALRWWRTPRQQSPTPAGPGPVHTASRPATPGLLRLPAEAITTTGTLGLPGGGTAAVVAAGTVNLSLRTGAEQAALLGGFARWLNSLSAPAQIVISTQRFDLTPHAAALDQARVAMPHPALAAAAADHAHFLRELGRDRDPLRRHVLLVVQAEPGHPAGAARRGEDTCRAMAALGVHTRVLDGPAVTAALAAAVDPYTPPAAGPRATPQATITTNIARQP